MKVILLAAGVGQRLKSSHRLPKCLLEFNGETLLSRHIKTLEKFPVTELLIVTGFMHEHIEEEINALRTSLNIHMVFNREYKKGSILSFLAACRNIKPDTSVILMDADVLYSPLMMDILFNSNHLNTFLLDQNFEPGDEPVKLCVYQNEIIEFRKKLAQNIECELTGESVGFFKFSNNLFKKLHEQANLYFDSKNHEAPYEEVIRDVLLDNPGLFNYEDITGVPWTEIDFPEDIIKAEKILNQINNSNQ